MTRRRFRALLVCSVGGHLTQMMALVKHLGLPDFVYVVNFKAALPPGVRERTVFITHAERNWKLLLNFWEGFKLCRSYSPDVIISTGAGQIIPFAVAAKLFGIPVVYIESMSRVTEPSLSGRAMYYLADRFYYQWPSLAPFYPAGIYAGPLL